MASQTISKICSVEGCPNPYTRKGYCQKHYMRVRRHGDPHTVKIVRITTGTLQERFDQCHRKDGPTQPHMETACWEWVGSGIDKDGYGSLGYNYQKLRAHRVSFFLHYGYWPLNALHKCDNKICVNWDHLYDGTTKDNARDALERGQLCIGERNGSSKLTNNQVREIKQRISRGDLGKGIASDYGVTTGTISMIRTNRIWKHIEV